MLSCTTNIPGTPSLYRKCRGTRAPGLKEFGGTVDNGAPDPFAEITPEKRASRPESNRVENTRSLNRKK